MTRLWWGLISNRDETKLQERGEPPGQVVQWQHLSLNVEKTNEIVLTSESALSACSSAHQWCGPWREWAAPSSWVYTSQRTSPGPTTLQHWPRTHSSVSTSSANSEEPEPRASIMCTFYRGTIESILTSCITVWYGACNASCRKDPPMDSESSWEDCWCLSPLPPGHLQHPSHPQSLCIAGDPTHPTHSFFSLLPSGRRLRSLQARTNRLKDSFIHQAEAELPPEIGQSPIKKNQGIFHHLQRGYRRCYC